MKVEEELAWWRVRQAEALQALEQAPEKRPTGH